MPNTTPDLDHPEAQSRRVRTLLAREVLACEDPICCCEAEPRWLRLEHDANAPSEPGEWEGIDRAPRDEL